MASLPPSHTHSTTRLTHAQAHTFLSTFLDRADNDAAYRPDSTLSERGPQALSSGSTPNLTLAHLKRILQGMEGKRIGGTLGKGFGEDEENGQGVDGIGEGGESEGFEDTGSTQKSTKRALNTAEENGSQTTRIPASKKSKRQIYDDPNPAANGDKVVEAVRADDDGWQDPEFFALAQETLEDERHPGVDLPQPGNDEEAADLVGVTIEETGEVVDPRQQTQSQGQGDGNKGKALTQKEKEERKKAKKIRHRAAKANRAEERLKSKGQGDD